MLALPPSLCHALPSSCPGHCHALTVVSVSPNPFFPLPPTRSRPEVPSPWDLIPDDLRWSQCNSNRNKVKEVEVMSDSLRPHGPYSPRNSPGHNTGVGSLSLLQGIFQSRDRTQVSCITGNSLPLSHKGSPRILEWVAHPFSIGSLTQEIEQGCPALQADYLPTELSGKP